MVSALFSYLPLLWSWSPDFAQGNEIVVKRRILFHLACWKKLIWMCSRERELLRLDETCIPSLVKRRFLGKLKGRRWLQRWEPCILSLVKKDFTGIAQGKEISVKSILLFPFARFCLSYMLYIIPIRYFKKETLEAMKVESATNYFVQNSLSQMLRESPKYAYSTVLYSRKTEGIFSSSKFWQNIPLLSQRKEGEYFPKKIYFRSRIEKSKGSL